MKREYIKNHHDHNQYNDRSYSTHQELNVQTSYENSGKFTCDSMTNDDDHLLTRDRKKRRGIIEKRRRDKINNSLTELKRLVPKASQKETTTKLEKAEILQLTVEHLRRLHDRGLDVENPRALGFQDCMLEISNYLINHEGFNLDNPLRLRVLSHLQHYKDDRFNNVKTPLSPTSSTISSTNSTTKSTANASPVPCSPSKIVDTHVQSAQYNTVPYNEPSRKHEHFQQNFWTSSLMPIMNNGQGGFDYTATATTAPAATQPQSAFTISNYSQNGIKISNYYNLGTTDAYIMPTNLKYPTNY